MNRTRLASLGLAVAALTLAACSTTPNSPAQRDRLVERAEQTQRSFLQKDPSLQELFDDAHAYAIFPSIGSGGAGLGASYGRGVVYRAGEHIGFCDVTQGDVGFQFGGQSFSQLIFFRNSDALSRFKYGDLHLSARASAIAATRGASAGADYEHGVMIFTLPRGGLMYEAAVGGQRFTYVSR